MGERDSIQHIVLFIEPLNSMRERADAIRPYMGHLFYAQGLLNVQTFSVDKNCTHKFVQLPVDKL